MVLEKAEFGTDRGIVEIDVETRDREQAKELVEEIADLIESEYDFERYR